MRVILVVLGLVLAWPLGAAAQSHDTLRIGMVQFPPDLHPYLTSTSVREFVLWSGSRAVTSYAPDGRVICVLCTEVPSLANGRARVIRRKDGAAGMETIFTLRRDLSWADGSPVTARDVAFSAMVEKAWDLPDTIASVVALNDQDFKVTLTAPRYDFDRWPHFVLPEHIEGPIWRGAKTPIEYSQHSAFTQHPDEPGLWMGPYRITAFRANDSITLQPNPYWNGPKPHFETIVLRLLENTAALEANLRSGDVDIVASGNLGITLDQALTLEKTESDRFDFGFIPSIASFEHLAVRLDNPLLKDKRVRQAVQMTIDREAIVSQLFGGKSEVADGFLGPGQFGYDPTARRYAYDPAAARALLAEAGFKAGADGILVSAGGERFSVDLVTTAGNRVRELIEAVIQNELKAIGIEIVIHNEPARTMFGETLRKRTFTGLVEFEADYPLSWVPDHRYQSRYIPSAQTNWSGQNYPGFANSAMDRAIEQAVAALEPETAIPAWKAMQTILAEELPEIMLFRPTQAVITPKWMTGLFQPERWGYATAWIEDWRER